MKYLLFPLLIILILVVGCQEGVSDEQIPTVTAVAVIESIAEATEAMIENSAAVPPATIDAIPAPPTPLNEEPIATLQLKFETDGAMAVRSFDITEYEFVDGSLDDWLNETPDNTQPWVALGRVVQPPYDKIESPFEPVWVVLKPDDMPDTVLFWEESADGELLDALSIYETVTLENPVNFSTLLEAGNAYYLPEIEGVLWLERLLVKTGDMTGELYQFVPDYVESAIPNLPYTFVCDDSDLRCLWTNRFETGPSARQEFVISYQPEEYDSEAASRAKEYFRTDNGRSLKCDTETAVCFEIGLPYRFECDLDNNTCTYEHYYEASNHLFTIVSSDTDWLQEDYQAVYKDYNLKPTGGYLLTCNWSQSECIGSEDYFSIESCDPELSTCRTVSGLGQESHVLKMVDSIVPQNISDLKYVTTSKLDKEGFSSYFSQITCDWATSTCYYNEGLDIYSLTCNRSTLICIASHPFKPEEFNMTLLPTKPENFSDQESVVEFTSSYSESIACYWEKQECWFNQPYRFLNCQWQQAICNFEQKITNQTITVPLSYEYVHPNRIPDDGVMRFEENNKWNEYSKEIELYCDWEQMVCYADSRYQGSCNIITNQCTIQDIATGEYLPFEFGNYLNMTEDVSLNFYISCNIKSSKCFFVYERGGGGALESRRCNLLDCPNGYFCSMARYNQYQCHLYSIRRPRR